MRTESISIEKCPLCGSPHTYELVIQSSVVVTLAYVPGQEKLDGRTFTRLFNCANGKGTFQMRIKLTESAHERIDNVVVKEPPSEGE